MKTTTAAATSDKKRKRPPTFAHLPDKSAKKAKREWVERQKIKSQWRATRRKEGLPTARTGPPRRTEGAEEDAVESGDDESSSAVADEPKPQEAVNEPEPQDRCDLRELRRQAYSSSSLHTHKADPLGRRRGTTPRGQGGRGSTLASRGREGQARVSASGRPADRSQGAISRGSGASRGQPNMRLRMNVMLERIKRDLT